VIVSPRAAHLYLLLMVPIVALGGQIVIGVVVAGSVVLLRVLLRWERREATEEEPDEDA
jgi:hypothetical protein